MHSFFIYCYFYVVKLTIGFCLVQLKDEKVITDPHFANDRESDGNVLVPARGLYGLNVVIGATYSFKGFQLIYRNRNESKETSALTNISSKANKKKLTFANMSNDLLDIIASFLAKKLFDDLAKGTKAALIIRRLPEGQRYNDPNFNKFCEIKDLELPKGI